MKPLYSIIQFVCGCVCEERREREREREREIQKFLPNDVKWGASSNLCFIESVSPDEIDGRGFVDEALSSADVILHRRDQGLRRSVNLLGTNLVWFSQNFFCEILTITLGIEVPYIKSNRYLDFKIFLRFLVMLCLSFLCHEQTMINLVLVKMCKNERQPASDELRSWVGQVLPRGLVLDW